MGFRPLLRSSSLPTQQLIKSRTLTSLNVAQDAVLAAQPTVEEWLDVCEPGLKKAVLAMFRACKEIAYKIRTASCDKVRFNVFLSSIMSRKHL